MHLGLFLFLCVGWTSQIFSAIGLKEAFEGALKAHPRVWVAASQAALAEESVSQAEAQLLPKISGIGTYSRQSKLDRGGSPEQTVARINLTQPLFRGLGEWAQIRSTKARHLASIEGEKLAQLNLFKKIGESYYTVLQLEKDLENLKSLKDLTEKRIKDLKQRVAIGRTRRGELLSAEAAAAVVNADVEAAVLALGRARATFANDSQIGMQERLVDDATSVGSLGPSLDSYLSQIDNRPDIRQSKLSVEATEESVSVANALHLPTLDFSANYYLHRQGALGDAKWDIGGTLTIPIFWGGSISAEVRTAVENKKQEELKLALLRRAAIEEITQLFQSAKSLTNQEIILKNALQLNEANYKEQAKDYRYGLVTNLEVLQAMNNYTDAKRSHDRTIYQRATSLLNLDVSIGKTR